MVARGQTFLVVMASAGGEVNNYALAASRCFFKSPMGRIAHLASLLIEFHRVGEGNGIGNGRFLAQPCEPHATQPVGAQPGLDIDRHGAGKCQLRITGRGCRL